MGKPHSPPRALLFLGLLWSSDEALEGALASFRRRFGDPCIQTPPEPFEHTEYYAPEMGPEILRSYMFVPSLIDPGELAEIKLWTNGLEEEAARKSDACARPVNLDPGYLALDKFVLATTKDRSHRIYIGKGIFAESTLHFHKGRFEPWPWTYPDYARPALSPVFLAARSVLRNLLRKEKRDGG